MRYVILHTPRTGSNVLCDMLVQSGLGGMKDLYDAGLFIGYGESTDGAYRSGAIDSYFARNRTHNGVEGCKLGWDYVEHLNRYLEWGSIDRILATFDRFVLLSREDRVAQAVSRLMARQTGEWTSLDEDNPRDDAGHLPVKYNFDRLAYFVAQITAHHAAMETWLVQHGITPLVMTYEGNAQHWQAAMERLLGFVGVAGPYPAITPRLQKQHDPRKEAWRERYYAALVEQQGIEV